MGNRATQVLLSLAAALIVPTAMAQTGPIMDVPMHPPPPPDTTLARQQAEQAKNAATIEPLKITFGHKSAQWTAATLAQLPHQPVQVYDANTKSNRTYSGVPLIQMLVPLGVPDKPNGKQFRLYLIAEGSDGYKVVYSVAEISPDVHNATVLVVDSMDGKPLPEGGPLLLVATGDKSPARWVGNVVSIKVMTAD